MLAFDRHAPALGADGQLLNLVPISAGIYAGPFLRTTSAWGRDQHLDPSYSLAAILLAIAELDSQGRTVPNMTLYYYPKGPHDDALQLAKTPRTG